MKTLIKRYTFFLLLLAVNSLLLIVTPDIGKTSFSLTGDYLIEMLSVLPPIFILLGLMDVWVDKETMMKYMGHGSGPKGVAIAYILGSFAAGPLYAAFPVAGVLLKKGVKLSNVLIFIGAWSTTKIPMLLFEASSLGIAYMLLRLGFNLIGIILIAVLLEKSTSQERKEELYKRATESL